MPFTPFHLGPGLAIKAVTGPRLSLTTFAVAQVAMDLEPLIHMLRGDVRVHGFAHTYLGATVVGAATCALATPPCRAALAAVDRAFGPALLTRLREPARLPWTAAAAGALIGTWSHVLLDSFMHPDLRPLVPWTGANPFLGIVPFGMVYPLCVVSGLLGLIVLTLVVPRPRVGGEPAA